MANEGRRQGLLLPLSRRLAEECGRVLLAGQSARSCRVRPGLDGLRLTEVATGVDLGDGGRVATTVASVGSPALTGATSATAGVPTDRGAIGRKRRESKTISPVLLITAGKNCWKGSAGADSVSSLSGIISPVGMTKTGPTSARYPVPKSMSFSECSRVPASIAWNASLSPPTAPSRQK